MGLLVRTYQCMVSKSLRLTVSQSVVHPVSQTASRQGCSICIVIGCGSQNGLAPGVWLKDNKQHNYMSEKIG